MRKGGDTLSVLERNRQGGAVFFLITMLESLTSAFNIVKNMDGEQLTETAIAIFEEYPLFTINDIAVCFQQAKKGAYGEIYDRLDTATVMKFLDQYYEAKLDAHEQYNRELGKMPAEPSAAETPAQKQLFAENMAKIKALLAEKKTPEKKPETVSTGTDRFQRWIRDFDKLYARKGKENAGMKFIFRYGKWLDVSGYLAYKEMQYNKFS